jgi:type 1 glutamine amidotransferase
MSTTNITNVLIFSKTAGYRHDSILAGIDAITRLITKTNLLNVVATEDAETVFEPSNLASLQVIVFLHTSGTFLTDNQLSALQDFVHSGGGVVAIHGSANGMPDSPWFGKLIGAHFDMHPDPEPGSIIVSNPSHPIIASQAPPERWMDEWYNFKTHPAENKNLRILLRGDTKTFKGGKHGDDHPLAWCQEFEGGRSFYIALGHFDEAFEDTWFMDLVLRAILWTTRREKTVITAV